MRDVLDEVYRRWLAGERVGVGTVVAAAGSTPRAPGSAMVVAADGSVVGGVSGGCVDGAVYELARDVIARGQPVAQRYGISDDDVHDVGLTCGGTIDVFVEPIDQATFAELSDVVTTVRAGRPIAVATMVAHPDPTRLGRRLVVWPDRAAGSLGNPDADAAIADDARGLLPGGRGALRRYGLEGQRGGAEMSVFVNSFRPPPRMLIFGAIDYAVALARLGAFLGYRVTVCDARAAFAQDSRFPDAEVVVDWPHRYLNAQARAGAVDERAVVMVLTHDPKFDVPLLSVALRLDVAYVGAMGSRRTHEDRLRRLGDAGLGEPELARLASPLGLDLGARTPEETAVSIAAEVIALRWGGSGARLSSARGRIHGEAASGDGDAGLAPRFDAPV